MPVAMQVPRLSLASVQVIVAGEILPGWLVVRPLPVAVERDDDGFFVVSDNIFDVYGDGATLEEAIYDYQVALTEYYDLVKTGAEGSPQDRDTLLHLQEYLRKE